MCFRQDLKYQIYSNTNIKQREGTGNFIFIFAILNINFNIWKCKKENYKKLRRQLQSNAGLVTAQYGNCGDYSQLSIRPTFTQHPCTVQFSFHFLSYLHFLIRINHILLPYFSKLTSFHSTHIYTALLHSAIFFSLFVKYFYAIFQNSQLIW